MIDQNALHQLGRDPKERLPVFPKDGLLTKSQTGLPGEATSAIGLVQRRQGRFEDSIRNLRDATRHDPGSASKLYQLALSLLWSRKFEEVDRVLDRVLTIAPDFAEGPLLKAVVREAWKGERDLGRTVRGQLRDRMDSQGRFAGADFLLGHLERNPREALSFLGSLPYDPIATQRALYPKAFFYAVAYENVGDVGRASKEYEAARPMLEAEVEKNAGRAYQHALLARTYAALGQKGDALRQARSALPKAGRAGR